MPRITKKDLQEQLVIAERERNAYQEAFWAVTRGDEPTKLTSGELSIILLAPQRMCGGVVVHDECNVQFADAFVGHALRSYDPYLRDLGIQVRALQREALLASMPEMPPAETVLRVINGGQS